MEIERINDSTIKFYISYNDIERRGFDKEEIWYSRERGEELFFDMMSEVNDEENFEINGPLWVQIHALDKGLEIIVTRGQMNDGNMKLEIPLSDDEHDNQLENDIVDVLGEQYGHDSKDHIRDETLEVVKFDDFEDLISLSHAFKDNIDNGLYFFEDHYYLYVVLSDQLSESEQDNSLSQILEYGVESDVTIYRIQEYGKTILPSDALSTLKIQFK